MKETSTHITRDRKQDSPLDCILEVWGVWRDKRVPFLSFSGASPVEAVNHPDRGYTDLVDRHRIDKIKESIKKQGYSGKEVTLIARKEWDEFKQKREKIVSRETSVFRPKTPKYYLSRFCSKIDSILAELPERYYKILIYRYEKQWEIRDFQFNWDINYSLAQRQLHRAREKAGKILKLNGYKV